MNGIDTQVIKSVDLVKGDMVYNSGFKKFFEVTSVSINGETVKAELRGVAQARFLPKLIRIAKRS